MPDRNVGARDVEGGFGVELVRGEVVQLPPHPQTCSTEAELFSLASDTSRPVAVDLFCGAGGLSFGLRDAGFEVLVGVDSDENALATHSAHFGGLHLDWDLTEVDRVDDLTRILKRLDVTLIAGGPPCQPFSRAGRSLIRELVRSGRRPPVDVRRDMWQAFLSVVENVCPLAVLMENVPDMILDRDMLIFRTMVDELERIGYAVDAQIVETSRYGVPQFRQRVILVALRDGLRFRWPHDEWSRGVPADTPAEVSLRDAIGDLPDVEPGWRGKMKAGYAGPVTSFQKHMRRNVSDSESGMVSDHVTRAVREDDLEAFRLLEPGTRYSELPEELKRYRDDIFDDKYKRLEWDGLSRTITAHMSKDGYWYIHPEYDRTLTIREAARIQTFGDEVRFAGPPTAALRQIGNAVPPELARHLGRAILDSIGSAERSSWKTREVVGVLSAWWDNVDRPSIPWLRAPNLWTAIQAEMLLTRARRDDASRVWVFISRLTTPRMTLERSNDLQLIMSSLGRDAHHERITAVADYLAGHPEALGSREGLLRAGVPKAVVDVALRIHPLPDEDPVVATAGVLRVAAFFNGSDVNVRNPGTDGRAQVARLVGIDDPDAGDKGEGRSKAAHLAIFELASVVCGPAEQTHDLCPLRAWCRKARRSPAPQRRLDFES